MSEVIVIAISAVSPLPVALAVVSTMVVTTLVVVVGYDLIHKVQTFLTVVSGAFFVVVTVYVVRARRRPFSTPMWARPWGAVWMMILGATVVVTFPTFFDNTTEGNAVNLYGCFITTSTIVSTWVRIRFTVRSRVALVVACAGICVIGVLGCGDFRPQPLELRPLPGVPLPGRGVLRPARRVRHLQHERAHPLPGHGDPRDPRR